MTCLHYWISQSEHQGMTWLNYIIYTSEYIPKLQIHQHSLLTRKVFSRHNWSAQVFFSVSSGSSAYSSHLHHLHHLHRQVIFIKSGSSLDHHRVWIITWSGLTPLDHNRVWIITWSRSSSNMDHHWIIIIITASAISIKWCYLFILLITRSSIEPAIFHVGCRPTLHVGLQHLYLT